jgi:hypothetical protein
MRGGRTARRRTWNQQPPKRVFHLALAPKSPSTDAGTRWKKPIFDLLVEPAFLVPDQLEDLLQRQELVIVC